MAWGTGDHHVKQLEETEYTLKTVSLFGEVNYQLISNLRLRLGGRYDRLWGDMDFGPNHTTGPQGHFSSKKIGIFSPKVGLLFTPLDKLDIYANYGEGFNVPGLMDGQFFSEHQLKMTKRKQYELGFRSSPYTWMEFGSVIYLANTKNDIQQNLTTKRMENAGQTRRRGVETYVKFFPVQHLTISADYAYQDVKYKKNIQHPTWEGRRLPQVARHIVNAEIAYIPPEGWGGRATLNYNFDYLLQENPERALHPHYKGHDFGTVDAQVNYRFNDKYKISLDVLNVFNDRPKQGVPNAQGYFNYWPSNPTTAYLTLEVSF